MTIKNQTPYTKEDIEDLYLNQQLSWIEIAKLYNTYPNKVRRNSIKWGIASRTKAEAQSLALSSERHKHPTKGTVRNNDTKLKISEGVALKWAGLTEEEKDVRREQSRKQWESMSDTERKNFQHLAAVAIRKAAKDGSKLERFLTKELTGAGYYVEFHKERLIRNENLHLDLFLPKINVVVEVDGPSHFEDIWGPDILLKKQKSDAEKSGLILSHGLVMIRVKTMRSLSAKYKRDILSKLLNKIGEIVKKYPEKKDRYIVIE